MTTTWCRWDRPPLSATRIVRRFRTALETEGMAVGMATTNLFWHPVFKDGAFTANDPAVRRYAIAKAMRGIDLGVELGAKVYVFWGGREGVEAMAAKPAGAALDRYREAIDFLCGYARDQHYDIRFALEPKPNEPRGDTFLPTVGHALGFIERLAYPEMVGLNPEVAHETMAGLSFYHGVAQAIWSKKLFHIDLNAQKMGRYDQDLRFGSEDIKDSFFLVHLLETSGYAGPKHFDARPYRVEDSAGIWDFAAGCMRTYLVFAREGSPVRCRRRHPGRPGRGRSGRSRAPDRGGLQSIGRGEPEGRALRYRGAGQARLPQRPPRPVGHRAAAGRAVGPRPALEPRPAPGPRPAREPRPARDQDGGGGQSPDGELEAPTLPVQVLSTGSVPLSGGR